MPALAIQHRLSGFYFFYYAIVGAFLPFWSLYLEDQGFNYQEIGILSSIADKMAEILEKNHKSRVNVKILFTNQTNMKVSVKLDSTDVEETDKTKFILKGTNGTAVYTIKKMSDSTLITAGGEANVIKDAVEDTEEQLEFEMIQNPTIAGTYTGTITFTASAS